MSKKLFTLISLSLALLDVRAAACRAISKFNKEVEDQGQEPLEDIFERGAFLGKGSFGEVRRTAWPYSAEFGASPPTVAIKRLNLQKKELTTQVRDLNVEVEFMNVLSMQSGSPEDSEQDEESPVARNTRSKKGRASLIKEVIHESAAPTIIECLIDKQNNSAYVIMELLSGDLGLDCLNEPAHTKKVCPSRVWVKSAGADYLELFVKISAALRKMHNAGLVHDDLKPENIGVSNVEDLSIKLIDFGLSQWIGRAMRGGTTDYMDFEKLRWYGSELKKGEGDLAKATPVADIYSLGVTMYTMLYARARTLFPHLLKADNPFAGFKGDMDNKLWTAENYFSQIHAIMTNPETMEKIDHF